MAKLPEWGLSGHDCVGDLDTVNDPDLDMAWTQVYDADTLMYQKQFLTLPSLCAAIVLNPYPRILDNSVSSIDEIGKPNIVSFYHCQGPWRNCSAEQRAGIFSTSCFYSAFGTSCFF